MTYQIEFSVRALRKFESLPKDVRKRLQPAITALAENPRPAGAIILKGLDRCYRVRKGDYRIVYAVRDDRLVVLVLNVSDRKEVYDAKEMKAALRDLKGWLRSL